MCMSMCTRRPAVSLSLAAALTPTRFIIQEPHSISESLSAAALELFPFLAQARLLRQWAGITDMTPDYSPIMGLSPVENYYLDAGWGTWGFKATPIAE